MKFHFYQSQQMYSASGFQAQLKKAFEDNASLVNYYIKHSVSENRTNDNAVLQQLMNSENDLGHLVGYFYGAKQKLSIAFSQWMGFTTQAIDVYVWKKNVSGFRKKWYEETDDLIRTLNLLSEWDLRELFYKHIALSESILLSAIKKDDSANPFYYNKLITTSRNMAEVIFTSILKDNKTSFS